MNKYYKKRGYQPLGVFEARGAQPAPHETDQIPESPHSSIPEQEVRKCLECGGTVRKDKRNYIVCDITPDIQVLRMCKRCDREVSKD